MKIELYSIDNCYYCERAKSLLKMAKLDYTLHHLKTDKEKEEATSKYPGARTFPIIIIDNVYIGGAEQLNLRLAVKDLSVGGLDL